MLSTESPGQSMPDWKRELQDVIEKLRLDGCRDQAIIEELTQHLAEQYDELISTGTTSEDACRAVLKDLHSQAFERELHEAFRPVSDLYREGAGPFSGLWKDLRLGFRHLRRSPAFAVVALLSLALGIGANTAIFELIDTVLLRALPVPDPQSLADVKVLHQGRVGDSVSRQDDVSLGIWREVKRRQQPFSSVAAWGTERLNLGNGGEVQHADAMWASGDFFKVLQIQPSFGRFFSNLNDDVNCGNQGVVISYSFWQSYFGGRGNVLESTLVIAGQHFPVVGVAPAGFTGLEVGRKFDVMLPLCSEPLVNGPNAWSASPTTWWLAVIGRLRPEWSTRRAAAQLSSIERSVFESTLPMSYDSIARERYLHFGLRTEPAATGVSELRAHYQQPLFVLLGISGLVPLIACSNIASLLLARAAASQHEIAVRFAIGASRYRVFRELLAENVLLATSGTFFGFVLARFVVAAFVVGISQSDNHFFLSRQLDWRLLFFTAALAVGTCLLFGLAPALYASRANPGDAIRLSGRSFTAAPGSLLLRRGFVVAQLAFSLVLVITALLFIRTLRNLTTVDLGFDPGNVLVADFDFTSLKLSQAQLVLETKLVRDQIRAIPGVQSASDVDVVPMSGNGWNEFIDIPAIGVQRGLAFFNAAAPGFFHTLRIPLRAGRDFDNSDTAGSQHVAIVNETFAAKYFPGKSALDQSIGVRQDGGKADKLFTIVGVVGNTKYREIREQYLPTAFIPRSQGSLADTDATFVIRSNLNFAVLKQSLNNLAAKFSPQIVLRYNAMQDSISDALARERLLAILSGFYAALAALLAVVGIYGVVSYMIVQRRRELGIRLALGAAGSHIFRIILGDALRLLSVGLATGLAMSFGIGRVLEQLLFGLKPADPSTIALSVAALCLFALSAALIPARRAARLNPVETLRQE